MKNKKKYRYQYVIGDLQGCFNAFEQLKKAILFDENLDKIWLCGDIVARGENSLATLSEAKRLSDMGALTTVLGNHDINLLAVWRGFVAVKPKDNTQMILQSPDCDKLLDWLRHQPLLVLPDDKTVLTHAGIPPHWSVKEAKKYAKELEKQLGGSLKKLDKLLPNLYNKKADIWSNDLQGYPRLRAIANYFTRMRLCNKDGTLEFSFKESLSDPMPEGFLPWFYWQVPRKRKILFGHWAALEAKIQTEQVQALDAGCVWGGQLLAYRLNDGKITSVHLSNSDKI